MKKAIFPGSFDPFTIGHDDIVQRGLALFDAIIIAVGKNSSKHEMLSVEERVTAIEQLYADNPKVSVCTYEGLTVDLAREKGAQFLLRGVRTVADFEYERNMAEANRDLAGIETIVLFTRPEYAHVSSSLVRELKSYNKDISRYLPTL